MLSLCYKRMQLLVHGRCCIISPAVDSINQFHCFQKGPHPPLSSSFSSKSVPLRKAQTDDKAHSFTVSYLIDTFGFSPELALSISNKQNTRFKSPKKPDSVVMLLKDYGVSDAHISEIAEKHLELFAYNAEKTLRPKIEFLNSTGISGRTLSRMFCSVPYVLKLSLERMLKPCYDISRALGIPKEKLPYFYRHCCQISIKQLRNVTRNVSILRAHGVPESSFQLWQPHYAVALSFESDKVKENVNKVISMGFCPKSPTFMKGLYVISVTDASKWEQKVEFYRKWGWTEDDVLLAFKRNPVFMYLSEKNISNKMDFYLNKMGLKPADVARCTDVLNYSLEKRIRPRCSVFRTLILKGFLRKEDWALSSIVISRDKVFLDCFVIKYQERVPELFDIFQRKMTLAELGLKFEEISV